MINSEKAAYESFCSVARACGSDPIVEEGAIVSSGAKLPPAHTAEYWEFLQQQTELAQAEHDREYASGVSA